MWAVWQIGTNISEEHTSSTCLSNYTEDHDFNTMVGTTDLMVMFHILGVHPQ